MPTEYAYSVSMVRNGLLALLLRGPMHGYKLRAEFEARTGGTWPLNIGQAYTTLQRLERDGLVTAVRDDAPDAPERYVLTDPGRRRIVVEPDARNERAIERLRRVGFVLGPEIDKPEKRARLAFLDRAEAEAAVKAVSHR